MHHLYFQFGIDRYEIVIPKMDRTSFLSREKKENARVISELNKGKSNRKNQYDAFLLDN